MVSHKHKCIFVHIPKVAGISVEQVFIDDLGLTYDNRGALLLGKNVNKDVGPPIISHLTAKEYVELHYLSDEIYDSYYKFAIVRNPYQRLFSFYKYLAFNQLVSFEKFVIDFLPKLFDGSHLYYFIQPMYNYLYSEEKLLVDYVGKLENIDDDFKVIAQHLNLNVEKLPHANNSAHMSLKGKVRRSLRLVKKYPEIATQLNLFGAKGNKEITPQMTDVVARFYGDDFKYFGYSL